MKQEQSPFYKRNKEFHSGSAYFYFFTAHTLNPHCICTPSKPDPAWGGCHGTCRKTLNLPGPSIPPLKNKIRQTQSPLKCWSSVKVVGSPVWSRQKCDFLGNHFPRSKDKTKLSNMRLQAPCISRSPLPSAGCTGLSIMVGGAPWPIAHNQLVNVLFALSLLWNEWRQLWFPVPQSASWKSGHSRAKVDREDQWWYRSCTYLQLALLGVYENRTWVWNFHHHPFCGEGKAHIDLPNTHSLILPHVKPIVCFWKEKSKYMGRWNQKKVERTPKSCLPQLTHKRVKSIERKSKWNSTVYIQSSTTCL